MHLAITRLEPRIETTRLVLRPLRRTDLERLVDEIDDFEVARMLARVPHPYTRAHGEDFLSKLDETPPEAEFVLAITRDDGVIGCMGLSDMGNEREFGYWLGRAHWGRGFATEAARVFLRFVFDEYDVPFVRAGVFIDNPASLRVQMKLGFKRTGIGRGYSLARAGEVERINTMLTRARFREATA